MAFSTMGLKQTWFCIDFVTLILLTIKMIAGLAQNKCLFLHMLPLHGVANAKHAQQTPLLNLNLLVQMKQPKKLFGLDNCCLVLELAKTSQPCSIEIIKMQSDWSKILNTISEPSTLTWNTLHSWEVGHKANWTIICSYHDQTRDLLTKSLPKDFNQRLWNYMRMTSPNFHLLTWVSGRNELYAHRANDTHDVWVGVLSTQKSLFVYESFYWPWEKWSHVMYLTVLFSCFMFLHLSSFLTMFKINLIVVTCRCKSNVV